MNKSLVVGFCLVILLITACRQKRTSDPDSAFKKSLVEKKITGTDFYISVPANYALKESRGADFSVYYFYPSNTTDTKSFRGGFYFGNAPGGFNYNDSCKIQKRYAYLLGDEKEWSVFTCNNIYSVQIITKSKSGYDWALYIHAFGRGSSKIEVDKLFDVYSTLKQKK